jgi:hypothetical protein
MSFPSPARSGPIPTRKIIFPGFRDVVECNFNIVVKLERGIVPIASNNLILLRIVQIERCAGFLTDIVRVCGRARPRLRFPDAGRSFRWPPPATESTCAPGSVDRARMWIGKQGPRPKCNDRQDEKLPDLDKLAEPLEARKRLLCSGQSRADLNVGPFPATGSPDAAIV